MRRESRQYLQEAASPSPALFLLHLRPSISQRHSAVEYRLPRLAPVIDPKISKPLELIQPSPHGVGKLGLHFILPDTPTQIRNYLSHPNLPPFPSPPSP